MVFQATTRFFSKAAKGLVRPTEFYFVDTNIIFGYLMDEYPGIKPFVDSPTRKFFYTETVKDELVDVPNGSSFSNMPFHFVESGLSQDAKEIGIKTVYSMWEERLKKIQNLKKQAPFVLTEGQKRNFHNDLCIVFEAGFARYLPNVLPQGVYQASLLTNNLKLYKKFVQEPEAKEVMDKAINLCGFEHLIDVETIKGALERSPSQEKVIDERKSPGPTV